MTYAVNHNDLIKQLMPYFLRDYDFEFEDGDIRQGNTEQQEIFFIMEASKGNYFYEPLLGVGIRNKMNSTINKPAIKAEIKEQLESDGFVVDEVLVLTQADTDNIDDPLVIKAINDNKLFINIEASR